MHKWIFLAEAPLLKEAAQINDDSQMANCIKPIANGNRSSPSRKRKLSWQRGYLAKRTKKKKPEQAEVKSLIN